MAGIFSKLVAKPEDVQKQAENSTAVKTQATNPGKKATKKIEEDKSKPKETFNPKEAIKTFEDNATEAFNRPDKVASGDELGKQLTGQSTAAQVQAEKPKEAYNEANPDNQTLDAKKEQLEEMANTSDEEVKENVEEAGDKAVPPEDKGKYNASTQSIWGAWQSGMFGDPNSPEAKNARNYLILDAIAAFASNAGRNLRNVGAQFSGGSIDNSHDTSMWEQRQQEMAAEERAAEREHLGGPAERRRINEELTNEMNELAKNKAATVNDLINYYKQKVDETDNWVAREVYTKAITGLAGARMDATPLSQAMGAIGPILQAAAGIGGMMTSDQREKVGSSFLGR